MAKREVDVAIIGAGTAGLAAYRRVREHTEGEGRRRQRQARRLRVVPDREHGEQHDDNDAGDG